MMRALVQSWALVGLIPNLMVTFRLIIETQTTNTWAMKEHLAKLLNGT